MVGQGPGKLGFLDLVAHETTSPSCLFFEIGFICQQPFQFCLNDFKPRC